ncbi:MAG TPA: hypothetical protein VGC67_10435 [Cellulomonas sp.]
MVWFLLLWCVVPALACATLIAVLPGDDRADRRGSSRRRAARRRSARARRAARATVHRDRFALRHRRSGPEVELPDPFDALQVQTRLTIVAQHLQQLEADPHAWARAERIIASQLAYDALLAQACRMAGVEVVPRPQGDPWERLREEVELTARGWTW